MAHMGDEWIYPERNDDSDIEIIEPDRSTSSRRNVLGNTYRYRRKTTHAR